MEFPFCLFGLYFTIALFFFEYRQMLVPLNAGRLCHSMYMPIQPNFDIFDQLPHVSSHRCNLHSFMPLFQRVKGWIQMSSLCRPNDQLRVVRYSIIPSTFLLHVSGVIVFVFLSFFFSPINHRGIRISFFFLFCLQTNLISVQVQFVLLSLWISRQLWC